MQITTINTDNLKTENLTNSNPSSEVKNLVDFLRSYRPENGKEIFNAKLTALLDNDLVKFKGDNVYLLGRAPTDEERQAAFKILETYGNPQFGNVLTSANHKALTLLTAICGNELPQFVYNSGQVYP